ncbi:chromogranin-A isoform X1 [Melanerpes formicivorus]|uniref:chromogranin-A isoform X1 n=1 Tax=Melanerpes formicivorus TaxID=211600 RepID=UPI00358FAB7A
MSLPGLLSILLLAVPAISLPVTNDMNKGDTKVMKCIVEVISDTLSKPNPLPISEECLETLRGDERIISILRHQNLLKELQEIAAQGASERTQQQKKSSGFEDELSEVLENQNDKNKERDVAGEHSEEKQPMGSLTELAAQKNLNEDSRKNTLEGIEPRLQNADPGEKENHEETESNEIRDTENAHQDEGLDSHISKGFNEDEQQHQEDEDEHPRHPKDSSELGDKGEQSSRKGQEQSKQAAGERVEREDDGGEDAAEEDPTEAERSLDLAEEDEENEEVQGDDNNDGALGFGKDGQSSEEEEEEEEEEEQPQALRGRRHHLEDEDMQGEEDTFQSRDGKSEEMEEETSREWEDSKRWNKMDELAKQLTSKKRMEENDSEEDPDRSMKKAFRSHKYDFSSPEEDVRRSWKHHSKEDSSEGGFPLAPMPEEKKDEEGSANRRTEDQELESLAAIEAELERVAHKLHELRRG